MKFIRPQPAAKLTKQDRALLLADYFREYRELAAHDQTVLNRKLPREAGASLLDGIGNLLLEEARRNDAVRDFLQANPLPRSLAGRLPTEFRAYCLLLNALKQWVSAEQLATDRYLLGGLARKECRQASNRCIASGEPLDASNVELHHPVRDGRPPIPITSKAHATLEGQGSGPNSDDVRERLLQLKREGNRSWIQLRRGCMDLLGVSINHSTPKVAASSKTFARKAVERTGLSYRQLLDWLDQNGLGA